MGLHYLCPCEMVSEPVRPKSFDFSEEALGIYARDGLAPGWQPGHLHQSESSSHYGRTAQKTHHLPSTQEQASFRRDHCSGYEFHANFHGV